MSRLSKKVWGEMPTIMIKPSKQAKHYLCNPEFLDWLEKLGAHYGPIEEKAEKWDLDERRIKRLLELNSIEKQNVVDRDHKLEAIKTLFLPLPEWVEWEEGPMSIEASKMLRLKELLEGEGS